MECFATNEDDKDLTSDDNKLNGDEPCIVKYSFKYIETIINTSRTMKIKKKNKKK